MFMFFRLTFTIPKMSSAADDLTRSITVRASREDCNLFYSTAVLPIYLRVLLTITLLIAVTFLYVVFPYECFRYTCGRFIAGWNL